MLHRASHTVFYASIAVVLGFHFRGLEIIECAAYAGLAFISFCELVKETMEAAERFFVPEETKTQDLRAWLVEVNAERHSDLRWWKN